MNKIKDLAEDILLNATDYIGNNPRRFGVDNIDMHSMCNNTNFRQMVADVVSENPEEYVNESENQEAAADFVMKLYVKWAYGN